MTVKSASIERENPNKPRFYSYSCLCLFFECEEIFRCVPAVRMIRSPMRARWLHWQPCDVTKNANPVDKSITALQFLCAAIKGLLTSTPARIGFWLSRGRDCITRWCDDVFDSQISWLLCDSACIPVHSESDSKAVWQTLVYTTVEL